LLQLRAINVISKNQILWLMKTVLSQNYFAFSDNIHVYQLLHGIAMGSHISSLITEIYYAMKTCLLTFKGRMLRLRHAACIPWWPNVMCT